MDTKFNVPLSLFMYGNGFLSRALPIGVKFYMAVRPYLGQVFSHFGDSPRDGRILGVYRGSYGEICFLLWHLFLDYVDLILSSAG